MGLMDLTRRVITTYLADTSQHEQSVGQLRDSLGRFTSKVEENGEAAKGWAATWNESLNESVEKLAKFNQAFEGAHKLFEIGKDLLDEYAEHSRLAMASASADVEGLSEAIHGLRSDHDLMSDAARMLHGALKPNQEQMEETEKTVQVLTRSFGNMSEVSDALTQALVTGHTRGLRQYGIDAKEGATHVETLSNIMAAFHTVTDGANTAMITQSESIQKLGTEFHEAFEKMKLSIAGLVLEMKPLLDMVGKVAGTAGDVANYTKWAIPGYAEYRGMSWIKDKVTGTEFNTKDAIEKGMYGGAADLGSILGNADAEHPLQNPDGLDPFSLLMKVGGGLNSAIDDPWRHSGDTAQAWMESAKKKYDKATEMAKQLAEARKKLANDVAKSTTDDLVKTLEGEQSTQRGLDTSAMIKANAPIHTTDNLQTSMDQLQESVNANAYTKYQRAQTQTALEKIFGKREEFEMYKDLWKGTSEVVGGAYAAMVTGSDSLGHAIEKSSAQALIAMGSKWAVQALGEAAEAIASVAEYDYDAAGEHGLSALKFAAAAAAAGVAASELGAGGGSSSSSGSGGGGGGAGGGGAGGGSAAAPAAQAPAIIVYGDSFADDSPRARQIKAAALVKKALGGGGTKNS